MDMSSSRLFLVATLGVALVVVAPSLLPESSPRAPGSTRRGDPRALQASYDRWKAAYAQSGGDRSLVLPLRYSKGLSAGFVRAEGEAALDLAEGTLRVHVVGLSDTQGFDVWLVDNRPGPGRTVRPEAGDRLVRAGPLQGTGNSRTLHTRLGRELLASFEIDLIVVARAGGDPGVEGLLFGAPSLFHRLYYRERRATARASGGTVRATPPAFGALVPSPAWADEPGEAGLRALVERGERLFFEETFGGNGRTCGTCHPARNNLTIDTAFIATLPDRDPLFVAEFNPDLAELENPVLLRRFGLIRENVDGLEDPTNKFVMRGVPHMLGLQTSLAPPGFLFDGTTRPPLERTGWSGDGAPASGTIREFAIGAVRQHLTRSLNRVPGVDFRLPTDEELDAMAAFQLSLGRQQELDLTALVFRGPIVEQGRQLFLTTAKCNLCHGNAGANLPGGGNANFNTGVEELPDHPANVTGEPRPRDGGFGTAPDGRGGFGNGTFNTPSLVEAADTGPFFHNNAVTTIEGAVDFYNSPAFSNSPSGAFTGGIQLAPHEVSAVAAFLRVINALENIESATTAQTQARQAPFAEARSLLGFSATELDDAIKVLRERGLHRDAVRHLTLARAFAAAASHTRVPALRNLFIGRAIAQEEAARADLVR
jgi:cytochrome c peroxidase